MISKQGADTGDGRTRPSRIDAGAAQRLAKEQSNPRPRRPAPSPGPRNWGAAFSAGPTSRTRADVADFVSAALVSYLSELEQEVS